MLQRTEIDQRRFEILKVARAAIRLRHSIAAESEINETLPRIEKAFDAAVAQGSLPAVTITGVEDLDVL